MRPAVTRLPRGSVASLLLVLSLLGPVAPRAALAQMPGAGGPPAVGVITAARRPITESTEFTGRIEAVNRVALVARVTGFLQQRLFQEGQEVKAGEVLFRLERPPFEAQLAQAQATLASAQAQAANAQVTLARARQLVQTSAGTQVNVDNAVAQERTAAANVLGAQAQVRVAEINLAYTDIVAPVDGRIGQAVITPGNVVGPNAGTIATIVSQDPMRVVFTVSQRQALELRNRYENRGGVNAVVIRIRLTDGRIYGQSGRIEFIDTQIDRSMDTLLIRALIPNPRRQLGNGQTADRELIDGQFVTVLVEGAEPVQAVLIPRAAVLQDQQGSYVFVVDQEGKAQRAGVRLGRNIAEMVVVDDGLRGGERVITEGVQRVRPGQPVNAQPVAAARVPGAAPGGGPGGGPGGAPGGTPGGGTGGATPAGGASAPPQGAGPGQGGPGQGGSGQQPAAGGATQQQGTGGSQGRN
ncbi:efflux RND transporter periplasmic adaptor subunit [Roseomonas sp. NAR14]|uniref:Efflux RND transporter periplasmic adaptor subunit n=1 Tax=Roseomonas acroporae TaxID=2937791 RepID=A0A9X1Y785_9PROT|nr:efflux RND transporter periplasmic adaptor subunit [Roseomonas acroporae]MCK8785449.1 efflux RND transporter periplasmic adaptor subunit [Roseomonas acroporae]